MYWTVNVSKSAQNSVYYLVWNYEYSTSKFLFILKNKKKKTKKNIYHQSFCTILTDWIFILQDFLNDCKSRMGVKWEEAVYTYLLSFFISFTLLQLAIFFFLLMVIQSQRATQGRVLLWDVVLVYCISSWGCAGKITAKSRLEEVNI